MVETTEMTETSRIPTRRWDGPGEGQVVLAAFTPWGHLSDHPIEGRQRIGRLGAEAADVQLPSQLLSSTHGEFMVSGPTCFYRDLSSTNGSLVNGRCAEGTAALEVGDTIAFAPRTDPAAVALELVVLRLASGSPTWQRVPLADAQEVIVGRATGVSIADEHVSEAHASFFQSSHGLMVIDLGSTNGVFLGGEPVRGSAPVAPLDVVRIGSTAIVCLVDELWIAHDSRVGGDGAESPRGRGDDGVKAGDPRGWKAGEAVNHPSPSATPPVTLSPPGAQALGEAPPSSPAPNAPAAAPGTPPETMTGMTEGPGARTAPGDPLPGSALVIDIVEKNVWDRVRKKTLLRDFHLAVEPGDLVLVLGGSGAGKSTFVNAVMGNDRAEGTVRYGDLDVYEEYDRIRYQIGYVPQQDLLRLNDSVWDTLLSAAQLRMPQRTSRRDHVARAEWAAELLGLSREGDTLVGRLSGGQRKRLSIAVELVGDPSLFFLDEPDSGLDGIMARSLMENLRAIADLGKMVLVITHGPDRAQDLFSKVLVLAKSERDGAGHMAFYGSVADAKRHFATEGLEAIVRRINRTDEGGDGLADHYIDLWEGRRP